MDENINLPNLLIVGAAKSGTTSLHNYLKQHPAIFMTEHKEPHFLINSEIGESRVHKGVITLEEYKKMFETKRGYSYKGESTSLHLATFSHGDLQQIFGLQITDSHVSNGFHAKELVGFWFCAFSMHSS